jgi:hypothetical protein
MSVLTKPEREVVLTIADDERTWSLYCDSRRFGGKIRRLAARWGVEPVKTGYGFRLTLPLRAVRFNGPRAPRSDADSGRKSPPTTAHFGRRRAEEPPETPELAR